MTLDETISEIMADAEIGVLSERQLRIYLEQFEAEIALAHTLQTIERFTGGRENVD